MKDKGGGGGSGARTLRDRLRLFTLHPSLFTLLALCCALSACTSIPTRTSEGTSPSRKPGGYYLDDGPGANAPANLEQTPDAEFRVEPVKASTARPYTVFGRTYSPMSLGGPYKVRGLASWYGKRYHGKPTASGEIYDMYAMTAAHPTLPIPSYARVTNLRTGTAVVVRINDRGPFHSDRLIDLSYAAAYKLGIVQSGSDLVEVEAIVAEASAQTVRVQPNGPAEPDAASAALSETARAEPDSATTSIAKVDPEPAGVYVQLGAFGTRQNAERFLARIRNDLNWLSDNLSVSAGDGLYRVNAGPYADRDQASDIASRIEQTTPLRPVVVTRQTVPQ